MRGRSKLRLPKEITEKMLTRLKFDTEFLARVYKTMDYSLLVGVYKCLIDYKSTTQFLPQMSNKRTYYDNGNILNNHTTNDGNEFNEENNEDEFGNTRLQVNNLFVTNFLNLYNNNNTIGY